MGTRNSGFTEDQFNRTEVVVPMSTYAKDTPITDAVGNYLTPDHTYLAPRLPGYNTDDVILQCKQENVYDALGKYSADHKVRAEALKKTNLCYEQATQFQKRPAETKSNLLKGNAKTGKHGCCLPFFLVVIGLLSAASFTFTLFQYFGKLKCGQSAERVATSGQLGASTSNDPGLAQRLQLLESNLTRLEALEANLTKLRNLESNLETLQSKLTPQQEEIERLKNVTKANEKIIKTLETRLAEERAKSHALNLTVINLTSSQKVLQSTTSLVNTTLKSDVRDLKDQIAKTKTTLNNIESNSALNFTNLVSKIEQEATHRRGNDSALKAEIDLSTLKRQGAITNLTRDLALLSTKASQDNKDLETRINNTINRSFTSLQTADQNTFSQVTAVNQTLRNMIMNISLTPGPQGLRGTAGAGNLSRCYEKKETFDSNTSAPFIANEVPQGYIVTGIFCTATSDARVISIDDIIFSGKPFKRCSYHRDSGGSGNIQLHSYMWVCPKNS